MTTEKRPTDEEKLLKEEGLEREYSQVQGTPDIKPWPSVKRDQRGQWSQGDT